MNEAQNCAYHYTVKRGDSFYLIAHRLGIQLRDLLEANPGIPPARLMVGDVLCIPYIGGENCPVGDQTGNGSGSGCENGGNSSGNGGNGNSGNDGGNACPPGRQAVVQEGQTASDLQLRYNLSYHTLRQANPDKDLEEIKGGDVLCVPESNVSCPLPSSIRLGKNDTLESVAMAYNRPVAALLRVNPCLAPEDFREGVTIRLPE